MARVPRNKGSYSQRKGGGFQVKYPLGWSEEKKRYDEYREEVGSEAEAIALIKAINDFVYHGGDPTEVPMWRSGQRAEHACTTLTVAQFAEEFIEMREKQRKVDIRTVESDRDCFKRIKPYIGRKLITVVTAHDIDSAYARMRSDGPDNLGGHAYSGTTLQKTHAFLSMMFDKAVDYDYIAKNPMAKVERPKRDTPEKRELTQEQAQALFSKIAGEPLGGKPVGVLLCMCCGLRMSEMLALTWADYSGGSLRVSKSLQREKQDYKPTKNGEERTVPCPPPLIAILADWQVAQKAWFAAHELKWSEESPIVSSRVGNHVLQRSFSKWFAAAREGYPIPDDFTVHGLRHTYVTFLDRECRVDTTTTKSMSGHKDESAFHVYTHTNEESRRKAAAALGSMIAPDAASERCQNCKLWTASPLDATKGACWAGGEGDGDGPEVEVTCAVDPCGKGRFSLRMTA